MELTDDQKLEIAIAVEQHGMLEGIRKLTEHLGYLLPLEMRITVTKKIYAECGGKK